MGHETGLSMKKMEIVALPKDFLNREMITLKEGIFIDCSTPFECFKLGDLCKKNGTGLRYFAQFEAPPHFRFSLSLY